MLPCTANFCKQRNSQLLFCLFYSLSFSLRRLFSSKVNDCPGFLTPHLLLLPLTADLTLYFDQAAPTPPQPTFNDDQPLFPLNFGNTASTNWRVEKSNNCICKCFSCSDHDMSYVSPPACRYLPSGVCHPSDVGRSKVRAMRSPPWQPRWFKDICYNSLEIASVLCCKSAGEQFFLLTNWLSRPRQYRLAT